MLHILSNNAWNARYQRYSNQFPFLHSISFNLFNEKFNFIQKNFARKKQKRNQTPLTKHLTQSWYMKQQQHEKNFIIELEL